MRKSYIRPVMFSLFILLVIVLISSTVACKSTSSPTPTPSASSSPTTTASATPSPTPTPSTNPPTITTTSLQDGVTGTAYSQTVQASGGTGAHSWGLASGSLPLGLSLDAKSGLISGTPRSAAIYFFTVLAIDSAGASSSQALSINVNLTPAQAGGLIITTNSLPDGLVGTSYSQTFNTVGVSANLTWAVAGGNLPAGLNLDTAAGTIYGKPTTAGTSRFTIQASGNSGTSALQSLSVTVTSPTSPSPTASPTASPSAAPPALTIATSSLPSGTVGLVYSQPLQADNGSGSLAWSYLRGSLPAGIFLDAQLGIIFGNPAAPGTSYFLVQVIDSAGGVSTQSLSLTVNAK